VHAWKACVLKGTGGSNPPPSVSIVDPERQGHCITLWHNIAGDVRLSSSLSANVGGPIVARTFSITRSEDEPAFSLAGHGLGPSPPTTGSALQRLAEDSRETRIGLSAAARKAAETLAKVPGSKVIKHAQAHRHLTASSSVLHGWDDKGNPIPFTLNVLNLGSLGVQVRQDNDEG
jgi:hypothetical protein